MNETLSTGLTIMLVGMGVVFAFLVIMIFVMQISTKVISVLNKLFPEVVPEVKTNKKKQKQNDDSEIALAIACAINEEARRRC